MDFHEELDRIERDRRAQRPVIVYGPAGCGKTRNAERLRVALGCSYVVDDLTVATRGDIRPLGLHLTNEDLSAHPDFLGARVMSFEEAMALVQDECPEQPPTLRPGKEAVENGLTGDTADYIRAWINLAARHAHGASYRAGWWIDPATGETRGTVPEKLCLIHSEISEAMEADRKGLRDDKLPHRWGVEVELADALIRIFDLAGCLGLDLGGAVIEKMAFNAERADHKLENRAAANGKAY